MPRDVLVDPICVVLPSVTGHKGTGRAGARRKADAKSSRGVLWWDLGSLGWLSTAALISSTPHNTGWRTLVVVTTENLKMSFFGNTHSFASCSGARRQPAVLSGKLFLALLPCPR